MSPSHKRERFYTITSSDSHSQQGGGGVMIWAGIIGDKVVGPARVPHGVKMDSKAYCALLSDALLPWYRSQPVSFKRRMLLMQDNAPSHASRLTKDFLSKKGFKEGKLMSWPSSSPDLNPIEHYWGLIKRELYSNGQQYNSLDELWEGIQRAAKSIQPSEIRKLTESMDSRLEKVFLAKGGYVHM